MPIDELTISRAILDAHHRKMSRCLDSDVLIVGGGPAGLVAAAHLAAQNRRVVIIERQLSPGGGIWGGGMAMNDVVVQEEAKHLLTAIGLKPRKVDHDLYTVDAVAMASALIFTAVQAGAVLLNLTFMEDVCLRNGTVDGLVINRTRIGDVLPVDPIVFRCKAVIDTTGHEAAVVEKLRKRHLLPPEVSVAGEQPMHAEAGELFVVERTAQVMPGLYVAGMAVCATFGGPRMGPIFGGMLLSGEKVAKLVAATVPERSCCCQPLSGAGRG
jgi:thiazole biosynthesis enzyme